MEHSLYWENNYLPTCFVEMANEWMILKFYKIKKSTLNKYRYLFNNYIYPQFHTVRIEDINTLTIDRNMYLIYEKYKDILSYSTLKSIIYLIKAVIMYAIKKQYISRIYINFEMAEHTIQREINVLNEEQEKKLVAEVMAKKTANHLGILLSLYTGIRLGEVCSLKVSDIDFVFKAIYVTKTVQRLSDFSTNTTNLVITNPKSRHSIRTIPLPDFLYDILISYGIKNFPENSYILNNKEQPYEPRTLQYAFQRIMKRCGCFGFHFHCLRHTFATKCIRSGFDIKTLSEILGHSNVSFTMSRYVHSDMDIKRKQMNILNENWEFANIFIS